MLPAPARAAGRHAQRLPDRTTEGQARRPLERLERDRARRRLGADRWRRGPRRADDHRDGRPHAARLRPRLGRRHAAGGRAGDAPRRVPVRIRQAARRPAADAERPRRPVHRVGGGDGDGAAAGARLRRRAATSEAAFARLATAVAKYWVCKRRPGAGRRGARVPRRQRLRRGVGPAAALPRAAAALDLGRLGERHLPRRAARRPARAGVASTRSSPSCRRRRAPSRGSTPSSRTLAPELREADEARAARPAASSSGWRSRSRQSLLVRHCAAGGRRRFLRGSGSEDAPAWPTARCRSGVDSAAIIERHRPIPVSRSHKLPGNPDV